MATIKCALRSCDDCREHIRLQVQGRTHFCFIHAIEPLLKRFKEQRTVSVFWVHPQPLTDDDCTNVIPVPRLTDAVAGEECKVTIETPMGEVA